MKIRQLIHGLLLFSVDSEVAISPNYDNGIHPIVEIYKDDNTDKVIITA